MNTKVQIIKRKIQLQNQEMSAIDLAVCEIKKRQTKTEKYMEQMHEDMAKKES